MIYHHRLAALAAVLVAFSSPAFAQFKATLVHKVG